ARKIGMSRTGQRDRLRPLSARLALRWPRAHAPRPVLMVAVSDHQGERRAERASVPKACEHLDLVPLDLLAWAPTVALLPAVKVGIDQTPVEHQPCRKPGEDRNEGRPVRLARRYELESHHAERTAARIT